MAYIFLSVCVVQLELQCLQLLMVSRGQDDLCTHTVKHPRKSCMGRKRKTLNQSN